MNARRVLVTGAAGFVGSRAVRALLARGFEVHGLSRTHARADNVQWHAGDFAQRDDRLRVLAAARPTHVLHAAWYVEHGKFWNAPVNEQWRQWTVAFAREAGQAGVQRFVGVGTCAEYDWNADGASRPRRESDPAAPATPYGRAKLQAWLDVLASATPMACAWGRLFHLYGEGEPAGRLVPTIIRACRSGDPLLLGPAQYERDFMSVEDAGAALAAVVDADVKGVVNIASGEHASVGDVVGILARALGARPAVTWKPPAPGDVPVMLADVGRLAAATGFRPGESLEAGLLRISSR